VDGWGVIVVIGFGRMGRWFRDLLAVAWQERPRLTWAKGSREAPLGSRRGMLMQAREAGAMGDESSKRRRRDGESVRGWRAPRGSSLGLGAVPRLLTRLARPQAMRP